MYALVMWIGDEPTTSVVLWNDVEVSGKKTRAKWGPKYWPVQVLRQSPDKDWLESLSVIANGQVIWSRRREEQIGSAPKKQKLNNDENTNEIGKKASRMSKNTDGKPRLANLVESDEDNCNGRENSSDEESEKNYSGDETVKNYSDDEAVKNYSDEKSRKNESDAEPSKNDCDDNNKNDSDHETVKNFSDEEVTKNDTNEKNDSDEKNNTDENCSDDETMKNFSDDEVTKKNSNQKNDSDEKNNTDDSSSCSSDFDESDATRRIKIRKIKSPSQVGPFHCCLGECPPNLKLMQEIVDFLKQLIVHMEETFLAKQRNSGKIPPKGKIELLPGSGVWISNIDVFAITKTCAKKPKEMVRRLMRSILSKEKVMKMTLQGRGSRRALPKNVIATVEKFVNENTMPGFQLSHAEYTRCLTQMRSTLRNGKTSSELPKLRSASSADQLRYKLRSNSDRCANEQSKRRESFKELTKTLALKKQIVSGGGSRKYKRIVQRKY